MPRWLLCTLGVCWLGLGCKPQPNVARAAERAQPHLVAFAQFDRWARRAGVSEHALRDRAGLNETTFAPLRGERAIVAAWVQLEGNHGFILALPANAEPPPPLSWVALRDPELGPLRVAELDHCRELLPHTTHPLAGDQCVLIARSAALPPPAATTVTLAFEASVH